MFDIWFLTSRSTKEALLKEILQKISITDPEKDMYILSFEILEDEDFEKFYTNITSQFNIRNTSNYITLEPLTATFI